MPKSKPIKPDQANRKAIRPALTPEARENQMISLAVDLAEQQLRAGTASSQVITHFLKLGSEQSRLERKKLEHENDLLQAKTESLKSAKRMEELYEQALNAMRSYSGQGEEDEFEEIF